MSYHSTPWVCRASGNVFFYQKCCSHKKIINGDIFYGQQRQWFTYWGIYSCIQLCSFRIFRGCEQRRLVSRGRWRLVGQVCCQGWSCPGPTSPRPPAVTRPFLGLSGHTWAVGGLSRTKAGHLGARWQTWNRGWRLQERRRRPPTSSLRTSPTRGLASKLMRMDSNTPLSLDESSRETSGLNLWP